MRRIMVLLAATAMLVSMMAMPGVALAQGADVCVSIKGGDPKVDKGDSTCDSVGNTRAVAINDSDAISIGSGTALAINESDALSASPGNALAINDSHAFAFGECTATATNDESAVCL